MTIAPIWHVTVGVGAPIAVTVKATEAEHWPGSLLVVVFDGQAVKAGGRDWISKAPMSVPSPLAAFGTGRSTRGKPAPRWSFVSVVKFLHWSMAGLPGESALVCAGPPLLPSPPSSGSTPVILCMPGSEPLMQEVSRMRL